MTDVAPQIRPVRSLLDIRGVPGVIVTLRGQSNRSSGSLDDPALWPSHDSVVLGVGRCHEVEFLVSYCVAVLHEKVELACEIPRRKSPHTIVEIEGTDVSISSELDRARARRNHVRQKRSETDVVCPHGDAA